MKSVGEIVALLLCASASSFAQTAPAPKTATTRQVNFDGIHVTSLAR